MPEISPIAMFFADATLAAAEQNSAAKPGSSATFVTGNHASLEITVQGKVNQQPVGLSPVGAAAAVAAPAAIANAVTKNSTNRPPLSSTNP